MVTLKMCAMSICNHILMEAMKKNKDAVDYNLHILTNREVEVKDQENVTDFTNNERQRIGIVVTDESRAELVSHVSSIESYSSDQ
jgi:hypothetical protein